VNERTLTVDDAAAVAALLQASDIAVLGHWDFTFVELEADLRNEDLEHIGWYDDAGSLIAYGFAGEGGESKVHLDAYVHPRVSDDDVGVQLLARLEVIGSAVATKRGQDHVVFDMGAYRQDERSQRWLVARGFTVGTTFTRMRIDFDGPVEVPPPAAGVSIRVASEDEADQRLVHRLIQESMSQHYGHVDQPYDEWRKRLDEHGASWAPSWIADLDGVPIGTLHSTQQFVEDENAGYVRSLGVLPAGRGRGIAKQLLHTYFSESQAVGRGGVILHVDVANVTNALAIYESVGMRAVLQIDAWTKTTPIPVTSDPGGLEGDGKGLQAPDR
jgi:GNAT superfamily N-acetyltransferase